MIFNRFLNKYSMRRATLTITLPIELKLELIRKAWAQQTSISRYVCEILLRHLEKKGKEEGVVKGGKFDQKERS